MNARRPSHTGPSLDRTPTRDRTDTCGGKIAASGLVLREPPMSGLEHDRTADPKS
jgi:hypothetical protein